MACPEKLQIVQSEINVFAKPLSFLSDLEAVNMSPGGRGWCRVNQALGGPWENPKLSSQGYCPPWSPRLLRS